LDLLAATGANSVRTWGLDDADRALAQAHKAGLTVLLGLWLGHKEQGFRYDDPAQVRDQFERTRAAILKYRNDPAVLAWGLGNEMEGYGDAADPLVWKAVEDIARMVKELDPNHPTMTVIAEIGHNKLQSIGRYCPDIDIVGVNSYGGAPSLGTRYRASGLDKPYVVTEFGPLGQWEVGKTPWGAPLEASSTEKAAHYRESYEKAVLQQSGLCLGSYAFTWGTKQEVTGTWYGMLLPDGTKLGAADAMSELWTGRPPRWPCPRIESLTLEGPTTVAPGSTVKVRLVAREPNQDPLQVRWLLREESTANSVGGAKEAEPAAHPEALVESTEAEATFRIPSKPGGYRVFVVVRNKHNGAATANVALQASNP